MNELSGTGGIKYPQHSEVTSKDQEDSKEKDNKTTSKESIKNLSPGSESQKEDEWIQNAIARSRSNSSTSSTVDDIYDDDDIYAGEDVTKTPTTASTVIDYETIEVPDIIDYQSLITTDPSEQAKVRRMLEKLNETLVSFPELSIGHYIKVSDKTRVDFERSEIVDIPFPYSHSAAYCKSAKGLFCEDQVGLCRFKIGDMAISGFTDADGHGGQSTAVHIKNKFREFSVNRFAFHMGKANEIREKVPVSLLPEGITLEKIAHWNAMHEIPTFMRDSIRKINKSKEAEYRDKPSFVDNSGSTFTSLYHIDYPSLGNHIVVSNLGDGGIIVGGKDIPIRSLTETQNVDSSIDSLLRKQKPICVIEKNSNLGPYDSIWLVKAVDPESEVLQLKIEKATDSSKSYPCELIELKKGVKYAVGWKDERGAHVCSELRFAHNIETYPPKMLAMQNSIESTPGGNTGASEIGISPFVRIFPVDKLRDGSNNDLYWVMGSDGLWDFVTPEDVMDICIKCGTDLVMAAKEIVELAAKGGNVREDDISCIVGRIPAAS